MISKTNQLLESFFVNMAASKQGEMELKLQQGDTVKMKGLKSKSEWNGKLATIIGDIVKEKNRWPIQINFGDKSKALLQTKNLEFRQRSDTKINVVEIQSNRSTGIGPLGNNLRNVSFTKSKLAKYIKNRGLEEFKSPFAKLLGYDLSIYVDPESSDNENNAGSVFLTCDLVNGLSPYPHLMGNSIVVCKNDKTLTSDRLWGILNFIFECTDYYDGTIEMSTKQRNDQILFDVAKYKQSKWIPRAGTGGIDIYCDNVNRCRLNQF